MELLAFSSSYLKKKIAVINGTDLFSEAGKLFAGAWTNGTKLQAMEGAAHKLSPTTRAGSTSTAPVRRPDPSQPLWSHRWDKDRALEDTRELFTILNGTEQV